MLNSLYGKFGMKDIQSKLKIMSVKEGERIAKNYNFSVFAELNNDKVLIKYTSRINEKLRKLFKDQEDQNDNINFNESGLGKIRGVPSAVQFASAISAYARISINKYKNIPGNPCIMSDTDSVVLPKRLKVELVGNNIGQMKLEHKIKKGFFIRKKLYAIINDNNKYIIKASGVNAKGLNFDDFEKLAKGVNITTERKSFNVNWKKLEINIVNTSITLKGLNHTPITLFNTNDTNFKAISNPIAYPLTLYSQKNDYHYQDLFTNRM